MPKNSSPHIYTHLARYYDRFFTFHPYWFRAARQKLLRKILTQVHTVCDLACGTGTTALELAQLGMSVYGVDLSPTMCRLARAKVRRAGADVTIFQGDMRAFRLPRPVDLITCEYDALNHVPRRTDLRRVAKAVARALRPGGYFYFDVNNRLAFKKIWSGSAWKEKPGVGMLTRGRYDQRRGTGAMDVDWFVRQQGGWRRFHEHVEQVAWTRAEIVQALRAEGFHRIQSRDAAALFRGDSKMVPGSRTFYVAQRISTDTDRDR